MNTPGKNREMKTVQKRGKKGVKILSKTVALPLSYPGEGGESYPVASKKASGKFCRLLAVCLIAAAATHL
jgi:hypothetical protein